MDLEKPQKGGLHLGAIAIVLSIVVVLAAVFGTLAYLLLKDDNAGKFHAEPSTKLLETALSGAITGEEKLITAEELNGFAVYELDVFKKAPQGDLVLEQAYFALGDGKIEAYTPVTYKGMRFGVTSVAAVSLEQNPKRLVIQLESMRIGRLPVPASWILGRFLGPRLPAGITLDGKTLTVGEKWLSLDVPNVGSVLEITALQVQDNMLAIRTTAMLDQLQDKLKQEIQDRMGEAGAKFNEYVDGLASEIRDFFK